MLTKYGSADALELREVDKPTPKDDEVLIKVRAASVNDWDWGLMRGAPFYIRLLCGLRKPKIEIPGVDVAGRVVSVGKNVRQLQPGDEVCGDLSESGFGAFAEFVCVPERAVGKKSPGMTFVEAAAIPHAAALAVQGLHDLGRLQPGQTLLINGAGGGVGTLGVQMAKAMGVHVTGVDSSAKLAMMRSLGFDQVIDFQQQDFTRNGQRYDLILDTKTYRSIFAYARALNRKGTYVTVGGSTIRLLQVFLLGPLFRLFSKKTMLVLALKPNKGLGKVKDLFEAGKLEPVIDGPFELSETPRAIEYFGKGDHQGKIIISLEP